MRSVRILLTALGLLQANAAFSEVTVRSGAHDGFSRLVFDVPPGTDWVHETREQKSVLTLRNRSDGFDLSRAFERIDRTHIQALSADASTVNIEFACDCTAKATLVDGTLIVIDVRPTGEIGSEPRLFALGEDVSANQAKLRFPSLAKPEPKRAAEPLTERASAPRPELLTSNLQDAKPPQETDVRSLHQAQEKLAEHIGMAATRGVLQPSGSRIDLSSTNRQPQIDVRVFDSSRDEVNLEGNNAPVGGNLRISASSDVPGAFEQSLQESTNLGVRCIAPSEVAIETWASSEQFGPAVSHLRSRLFSERDVLDRKVAIQLAKTYLHFGFGPEAKEILDMDAELASDTQVLRDMAEIMEFGSLAQGSYLRHFVDCNSDVALWAQLASPKLSSSQSINTKAALRALSALPWHLRKILAPALSQKLLAYGDRDAAAAALRGLERTSNAPSPDAELARASIELEAGQTEAAQRRLQGVVTSNAQQSAEALIKYVDTQFDADVEIEDDIATLVEAYAVEMRDDPLGDALRRAHVLALAKSDQFADAFEELERLSFVIDADTSSDLRSSVLSLLAQNADDATFLQLAFANGTANRQKIERRARFKVSERLSQLGFHAEAEAMLPDTTERPLTTQQRLLRAKIALGMSRPEEALAGLARIDGPEADALRARARAANGDHIEAFELYRKLGEQENQTQAAWLSDDWSELLSENGSILEEAARVAQTGLETPNTLDGMLARSEAALAESSQARDVLERLLRMNPAENGAQN